MPENYHYLRIRLRFEQIRLLKWGEQIGLAEDVLGRTSQALSLNRNIIIDILFEIQAAFRKCAKVQETYEDLAPEEFQPLTRSVEDINNGFSKGTNAFSKRLMQLVEKGPEATKRLRWAAIDHMKFTSLVDRLITLNDSIEGLLDRQTIRTLQSEQHETYLVMLQLSSKFDDLTAMCSAMNIKPQEKSSLLKGRSSDPTEGATPNFEEGNQTILRLVNFKSERLALEASFRAPEITPIDTADICFKASDGTRTEAVYRRMPVFIEWKKYVIDPNPHSNWNAMIEDRIKKLVMLLSSDHNPPEFRSPHCLGYFNDPEEDQYRYGIVYNKPANVSPNAKAVSLLDLIVVGTKLSLTARIKLAHAVASSLLYLHAVDWLHKSLRSDSIIFFTVPGEEPDLMNPTLAGFDYARPDRAGEQTDPPPEDAEHDLYRHSELQNRATARSKKAYDVYSLGIVMIEIAHWKRIDDIIKLPNDPKAARRVLRNLHTILLRDDVRREVEAASGDGYYAAVKTCLTINEQMDDHRGDEEGISGAELLKVFMEQVVNRLGSLRS